MVAALLDPSQRGAFARGAHLSREVRLLRYAPEQVRTRPEKFNAAAFAAGALRTADPRDHHRRLRDVACVTIADADRQHLAELRQKRNRVMHFRFDDTADAVSAITARGLAFALDFIAPSLRRSP